MPDGERILIIPRASPIDAYTMGGIIRDAGLSVEQFRNLLWDFYASSGSTTAHTSAATSASPRDPSMTFTRCGSSSASW